MAIFRKIAIAVFVLAFVLGSLGLSVRPAQASNCTQWYTVQYGDTLYKIGVWYGVSWTYLAQINHLEKPNKIYAGQVLCVSTTAPSKPPSGGKPVVTSIPTFKIYSVVRNGEVTIYTNNFPPNLKFNVLMGPMGTQAIGGYQVASFNSGKGGAFYAGPFPIPSALNGSARIAIRAQNSGTGFFAYNWFYNNNAVAP